MKLLEILQKELKEFPEGMLYAVQDYDGEVKFGKHSQPTLWSSGVWNRHESWDYRCITGLGLAEDWDSAIVTKDMWENGRVEQIIVNVVDLVNEEKKRIVEALAKVKNVKMCNPRCWDNVAILLGPSFDGEYVGWDYHKPPKPTHTPQQVLEMAGIVKQGHVHADLMALYAEDAKTTDKPWELWQIKLADGEWCDLTWNTSFAPHLEYRRKPKTHTVNGVEVPDLRFVPKEGEKYYLPYPLEARLHFLASYTAYESHCYRASNNLCYEPTEEGKQAAILHAKAWLGIA